MILEKDEDGFIISKCKECVFAQFEQTQPWHKTQVGCLFDRVDKFKNRGTNVEWVEGDAVSANEVHVFCNNIRSEPWLKEHKVSVEEGMKKVRKDNTINWSGIVYTYSNNIQEIKNSVLSLSKSKIKPEKIMVSVFNKDIDYIELVSGIRAMSINNVIFNRIIENKYEKYLVDYSVNLITSNFYMEVLAGQTIQEDTISKIDNLINDDCKMVSMAKNEDGTIQFINRLVHKSLYGNEQLESEDKKISSIEEKLVEANSNYKETIVEL